MENDRNAPATKGDLETLRSELHDHMTELRSGLTEQMRDVQTELLRAFYSYAQSADTKLKEGEIADFTIRQRVTTVESRLTEIEKRLNLPPAA
ncbi:MAG: hypothetical protein ABSE21_17450 [Bryobacteraceae bacterium]|jgi:hypothetical protein